MAGTLLAALVAGFSDAPSGTVRVWKRGTDRGTPASIYSDYAATEAVSNPADLTAAGRVTLYVVEDVEAVVYDADGAEVYSFETGHNAAMVGIVTNALTGTLESGSIGAGGLVALQEAMTRMLTSFGTVDFDVKPAGGSVQHLKDALAAPSPLPFYDVTKSVYGAVGDDSTDDTAAIQAAIDAANAAGGGIVWLPGGNTYKCLSAITIKAYVSFWGAGITSILKYYGTASADFITVNTGSTNNTGITIQDFLIDADGGGSDMTGDALTLGANANGTIVRNVEVTGMAAGASSGHNGIDGSAAARCTYYDIKSDSNFAIGANSYAFNPIITEDIYLQGDNAIIFGGSCDNFAMTGGPYTWCGNFGTKVGSAGSISTIATGSFIDMAASEIVTATGITTGRRINHQSPNMRQNANLASPATFTPDANYGYNYVATSSATITIANPVITRNSRMFLLTIQNSSGGALTVTYGANYLGGDTSIASGKYLNVILAFDLTAAKWFVFSSSEV